MIIYHGTAAWRAFGLADGRASNWHGLYVTDTADRAQLYADAVASHEVSPDVRRVAGSVVVEMETNDPVDWLRRPASHHTLDQCEATIKTWHVRDVIAYASRYDLAHSVCNIGTKYEPRNVRTYEHLRAVFGHLLTIVLID